MSGRIAVAVSGGRDSTALLHATARAAQGTGIEVHALHVHHGLVAQADTWVGHLKRQCQRWRKAGLPVDLNVSRLDGRPPSGDSVEAWARRERYRALAGMAHALGIDTVLLAHHQRDQAETLLLQALRGGGPAGLAAMPREALRGGIRWLRPWLEQPDSAIEAYVRRHRLSHILDTSNQDPRFARNRLRVAVWPALVEAFPMAAQSLAAAARHAHEAAVCAAELAAIDLPKCVDAQGRLGVAGWSALEPARRTNLLRAWLRPMLPGGVPDSLVQRLAVELPADRSSAGAVAAWPCAAGELRLHRGKLQWTGAGHAVTATAPVRIDLSRPGHHTVPAWGGAFEVCASAGQGIPARLLVHAELRPRAGGEQFQRSAASVPRSLKKQFQASGVAAWQRDGPLVYAGDQLLYVPGLGIDARVSNRTAQAACDLRWQSDR